MSLSLPQINTVLAQAIDACLQAIEDQEFGLFSQMQCWLSDGVFNHEPHGTFRCEQPYRPGDVRTVEQFLTQPARHRWEGRQTLFDVFSDEVLCRYETWVRSYLEQQEAGIPKPLRDDEWESVYYPIMEEMLDTAAALPLMGEGLWREFLGASLSSMVEPWRMWCEELASRRARKAARLVSRQHLEKQMIHRVEAEAERLRKANPRLAWPAFLEVVRGQLHGHADLHLAVFVHSHAFLQLVQDNDELRQVQDRYRLPEEWHSPELDEEDLANIDDPGPPK